MTSSNEPDLLKPGDAILNGQYIIEKYLGKGGQGQVYLAHHKQFGQVAIKRLRSDTATREQGQARFDREIAIAEQLRKSHGDQYLIFIRHFDQDSARQEWFSVMDYANGGSLYDKLASH